MWGTGWRCRSKDDVEILGEGSLQTGDPGFRQCFAERTTAGRTGAGISGRAVDRQARHGVSTRVAKRQWSAVEVMQIAVDLDDFALNRPCRAGHRHSGYRR